MQYTDIITKKYMYDDLNQLIQESVKDTRVDCTNTANINVCYVNTYNYDKNGNITNQKTYKYINTNSYVVDGTVPEAYSINIGPNDMYMYYNTSNPYDYMYSIPVGGTLNLSFIYYAGDVYPLEIIYVAKTTLVSSNVDVNTPGYYLLEYHAKSKFEDYELDFGIVVKVGDVAYGELVNEISFSYDDTWLDQLDSYTVDLNGVSKTSDISYDLQGNPIQITNFYYNGIKYHHATLSWYGRQLMNIKIYSSTITKIAEIWYSYNDQGLRVSKILDTDGNGSEDKKYQFVWSGDIVISEIVSNYSGGNWVEQYQINYIVDYDGTLIGFKYCVGDTTTTYYYVLNLQGDVTKITSSSGYVYVEYSYDSYGNLISISGIGDDTYGLYNSYRYRSYKYDTEIGMYYLNSRYYNPEIGRFINADGLLGELGNVQSNNMYAYCANNPVTHIDPSGLKWYDPSTWSKNLQIGFSVALIVIGVALAITTGPVGWALVGYHILGSVMLCAGGTSLIWGWASEANYGDFSAGWTSGLVSGSITGLGLGIIGLAATSGNIISGLVAAGILGAIGNYVGTRMKQNMIGYSDDIELFVSTALAGLFTIAGGAFGIGASVIADEGFYIIAAIYGIIVEGVTDIISTFAPSLLQEPA